MSMSRINQFTASAFHRMDGVLSKQRYLVGDKVTIAGLSFNTPNTRLISLLYLSIALGSFSGWAFWNNTDWPKYGLRRRLRDASNVSAKKIRPPLTRDLEREPLQFEVLVLAGA